MVQLHNQLITFLLILIIGGLLKRHEKKMISSLEKGVKYTGNNETKRSGRPYLISSSYEINPIANSMERRLGLRYTILLINCHRQTHGDNVVCRSTVNLSLRIIQPKIKRIQKIQQGTKNEVSEKRQGIYK